MSELDYGAAFKRLRVSARLSLADVAQAGGIDKTSISDFERGKTKSPGLTNLAAMCRGLNITFDELLREAGAPKEKTYWKALGRLRRQHGLSVVELAERIGADPEEIRLLEQGKATGASATLRVVQVCNSLSVYVGALAVEAGGWEAPAGMALRRDLDSIGFFEAPTEPVVQAALPPSPSPSPSPPPDAPITRADLDEVPPWAAQLVQTVERLTANVEQCPPPSGLTRDDLASELEARLNPLVNVLTALAESQRDLTNAVNRLLDDAATLDDDARPSVPTSSPNPSVALPRPPRTKRPGTPRTGADADLSVADEYDQLQDRASRRGSAGRGPAKETEGA